MRFAKYTLITMLAGLFVLVGCDDGLADLEVENQNDPNRAQALANSGDLVSLIQGSTSSVFFSSADLWGVHMAGLADQTTSTNAFLSFWDFTFQPRLRINNRPSYADSDIIFDPWSSFNGGVSSANEIIQLVEEDGESIVLEDGTDVTQKLLAASYFLRGVSRGYIGMIYDKAYVVNIDTEISDIETQPYSALIAAAVRDLDTAVQIAEANDFNWDLLPGANVYTSDQLAQIANSYAARFLINEARTNSEAASWPDSRWNTIIEYAENGVGSGGLPSFSPASVSNEFWCNYCDWNTFTLSDGSGYLPTDIKVAHLLDPSYPTDYPEESGVILDPVETDDPRASYFNYTEAFGFLNADRDRSLFSNYWNLRIYAGNDWITRSGFPIPLITGTEMQYIKAEAYFWLGQKGNAATALNNSPRGTVPTDLEYELPTEEAGNLDFGDAEGLAAGITTEADISDAALLRALHEEYAIELDMMGGIGLQWYFMRRHNLLQVGTPLHYPIPGEELEITQSEYYTFGGPNFANEEGTADGSNSWKTFDEDNGLLRIDRSVANEALQRAQQPTIEVERRVTGSRGHQ